MKSDPWTELWDRALGVQVIPSKELMILTLVAALALTAPPAWRWSRNFITVVHEGGHALMAILWGRRVSGIKLHSDTSGVTISQGKPYGLGVIFTLLSGYAAPGAIGLLLAYLLSEGRVVATMIVLTFLLMCMFLMIRNFWGFVVMVPAVTALYFITRTLPDAALGLVLSFIVWFLITGAFRPIVEVQIHRMRGEAPDSDLDQLRRMTLVLPGEVWFVLFLAAALACAGLAVDLLLLR